MVAQERGQLRQMLQEPLFACIETALMGARYLDVISHAELHRACLTHAHYSNASKSTCSVDSSQKHHNLNPYSLRIAMSAASHY